MASTNIFQMHQRLHAYKQSLGSCFASCIGVPSMEFDSKNLGWPVVSESNIDTLRYEYLEHFRVDLVARKVF